MVVQGPSLKQRLLYQEDISRELPGLYRTCSGKLLIAEVMSLSKPLRSLQLTFTKKHPGPSSTSTPTDAGWLQGACSSPHTASAYDWHMRGAVQCNSHPPASQRILAAAVPAAASSQFSLVQSIRCHLLQPHMLCVIVMLMHL